MVPGSAPPGSRGDESPRAAERDAPTHDERGDSETRTVARGAAVTFLGNYIGVLEPVLIWFITWRLGAGVLGSYLLGTTYVAIALRLATVGLDKGLLRHLPIAAASHDPAAADRSVLATTVRLAALLTAVAFAVLAFGAEWVVALEGDGAGRDGAWWVRALSFALPAEAATMLLLAALRGRNRMTAFVVVRSLVVPAVQAAVCVPWVLVGGGAVAVAGSYVVAAWVGLIIAWVVFARTFRDIAVSDIVRSPTDREMLAFSLPQGLTELMNFMLARVDVILLSVLVPDQPELIAVYTVTSMLAGLTRKVRQAFDTSVAPMMSTQLARGDHAAFQALFGRVALWVLLAFLLVALPVAVGARFVLQLFPEGDFSGYAHLVWILTLPRLVNAATGPTQMALLMAGRSRVEVANNFGANVLIVGLQLAFIPLWGATGAAWASCIGLTAMSVARAVQTSAYLDTRLDFVTLGRALAAGGAGVGAGVAVLATSDATWVSAAAAVAATATYLGLLRAVGLGAEAKAVYELLRSPRRKRAPSALVEGDNARRAPSNEGTTP